jgi:hypothetical protein
MSGERSNEATTGATPTDEKSALPYTILLEGLPASADSHTWSNLYLSMRYVGTLTTLCVGMLHLAPAARYGSFFGTLG